MAFSDPITITIAAVAKTLNRLSSTSNNRTITSVYGTDDGVYNLTISHTRTNDGKIRSVSRLDFKKIVADPLTAVNDYEILSTYAVSERPEVGFSVTEVKDQLAGFNTWHGLAANQDKLYGRQS